MSFSRIKGVFLRYYYNLIKGPTQLSDLFYWPFIDILLWGLTSIWVQRQTPDLNLPLIIMTGLIFWQIAQRGSFDIAISLLQEFWHRNLVNMFSTPLKISEWAAGILLFCLCKLIITVLFGSLLVYLFYSLNVFTLGWAFLPFAVMLLIFGWIIGFLASSLIIYYGHNIETVAWMAVFLFAPFSAVFYPVSILPEWTQVISWSLPTTYVFEGMRQILHGQPFPLSYLAVSFTLNILYLCGAIALFRWSFEKSRNKGLARLE